MSFRKDADNFREGSKEFLLHTTRCVWSVFASILNIMLVGTVELVLLLPSFLISYVLDKNIVFFFLRRNNKKITEFDKKHGIS